MSAGIPGIVCHDARSRFSMAHSLDDSNPTRLLKILEKPGQLKGITGGTGQQRSRTTDAEERLERSRKGSSKQREKDGR